MEMANAARMDAFSGEVEEKKYEMTDQCYQFYGADGRLVTVYQIRALKEFGSIKKGDLGGWVEKESNLSQTGDCWVQDGAYPEVVHDSDDESYAGRCLVYGDAEVFGNAKAYGCSISEFASIGGDAVLSNTVVKGTAIIADNAKILDSIVDGSAIVKGAAVVVTSELGDHSYVGQDAKVFNTKVVDNSRVDGSASVYNSIVQGGQVYDGEVCIVKDHQFK